jgi:phospholipid transport system substrate-binding protein
MINQPIQRHSALKIAGATMLAVVTLIAIAVPLHADQGPMDVVKGLVTPALQILGDKSAPLKDRQEKLRSLVGSSNFDFTAMARSALGLHWKDLNDQQRDDFTKTFTSFLQDSYLSRIQDYSGQQVNYLGASDIDAGRSEVKTTIDQAGGKAPIQVNYMLRQDGGKWLIYDVTVDNISIAANYRNQFNRVINNQGFDTLLADLKRKQQGLEDQLGTQHTHD